MLLFFASGKFVPMKLVERLMVPYGFVLEVCGEDSGRPVRALQDPRPREDGVSWISHADRHPLTGELWLGSHSNDFIGILASNEDILG